MSVISANDSITPSLYRSLIFHKSFLSSDLKTRIPSHSPILYSLRLTLTIVYLAVDLVTTPVHTLHHFNILTALNPVELRVPCKMNYYLLYIHT